MDFIPYNEACFQQLTSRFEYLFEPKLINEICRFGKVVTVASQTVLMERGQAITHMPLVIDGAIKVMTEDKNGVELLLYYLESGDTCTVTINCCTRSAKSAVRAITETEVAVIFIPVEKIEEWMVTYKTWRAYILESYSTRLDEMLAAIDNLVFNSMEDRIRKYIHDKAWTMKTEVLDMSHADIAKDLHSSRVVISRIMKKLELEGYIEQYRGRIKLANF